MIIFTSYRVEDVETASCTVVFFIVYFFMMAGVTWFVILAYSWHVSFKKLQSGGVDDKLKGKIAYFHITAWTLPLICAIIAMSLQKVGCSQVESTSVQYLEINHWSRSSS